MSSFIKISLPMPFVKIQVSGVLAKINKPSGMQYMLLRMIKFGSECEGKYTIADLTHLFGLPEDLSDFVITEINKLQKLEMISTRNTVSPRTSLKSISLTELGEDVFERGRVSIESKRLDVPLIFKPGLHLSIGPDENLEVVSGKRYQFSKPDIHKVDGFLRMNRKKYGIDDDDQIYSLDYKMEREHSYIQHVSMEFDEQSGQFVFTSRSETNIDFIKLNYTGEEIIKGIPDSPFVLRPNLKFDVKRWGDQPICSSVTSYLPIDFDPYIRILINSSYITRISDDVRSFTIQEGLGCDCVYFESSNVAYKVWFSRAEAGVSGFDGTKNIKLVLTHRLVGHEMDELIDLIISNTHYERTDDLDFISELTVLNQDPSIIGRVVKAQLADPDIENLKKELSRITRFKGLMWWDSISDYVEDVLVDWLQSLNLEVLIECLLAIDRRDIHLTGQKILPAILDKFGPLEALDIAFQFGMDYTTILSGQVKEELIKTIMSGQPLPNRSSQFKVFSDLTSRLSFLRKSLGLISAEDYYIDNWTFTDDEVKEHSSSFNSLSTDLSKLDALISPYESGSVDLLRKYVSLLDIRIGALRSRKQFRSRADFVNEDNPCLFFIRAREMMFFEVGRIMNKDVDESMLRGFIAISGALDNQDKMNIIELLDKSVVCLHTKLDMGLQTDQKKRWMTSIFRLSSFKAV